MDAPGDEEPRQLRDQPRQPGALARHAGRGAGVDIYPGFAAAEVLFHEDGSVKGVATGDLGIGKDGKPTEASSRAWNCTRGTPFSPRDRVAAGRRLMPLQARAGPRSAELRHRHQGALGDRCRQVQVRPGHPHGRLAAAAGPYGGSFLYHFEDNKVAVGYVIGLDYRTPTCRPSTNSTLQDSSGDPDVLRGWQATELWRSRHHRGRPQLPAQADLSRRLPYRLRRRLPQCRDQGQSCRNEERHARRRGGLRSGSGRSGDELADYVRGFEASWLHDELHRARNFKPAMSKGLWSGTLLVGLDQVLFRGKAPFTLHGKRPDHEYLKPARNAARSPIPSRTAS